jgi:hypothetical protein
VSDVDTYRLIGSLSVISLLLLGMLIDWLFFYERPGPKKERPPPALGRWKTREGYTAVVEAYTPWEDPHYPWEGYTVLPENVHLATRWSRGGRVSLTFADGRWNDLDEPLDKVEGLG